MVRDRVGNSIASAKRIRPTKKGAHFRDVISNRLDPDDIYRFKLKTRSRVNIKLSKRKGQGNANIELYRLARKERPVLKSIGSSEFRELGKRDIRNNLDRMGRSRRKGIQHETLRVDSEPGVYFLRVFPKKGTTEYRVNVSTKTIRDASITLNAPNGGESLTSGSSIQISWNASISSSVQIDLLSNGLQISTIASRTKNDGLFVWDVPHRLPHVDTYKIRISSTRDSAIFDESDAPFEINQPVPSQITSPQIQPTNPRGVELEQEEKEPILHDPSSQPSEPENSNQRFDIVLDYRFDTQGWFTAKRKAALESAASIWEAIIQDEFETVPSGTPLGIIHPETLEIVEFNSDIDINDVMIFVGAADLNYLAEGGPAAKLIDSSLIDRYRGNDFEPWTGSITFDKDTDWFFDASPEDASDLLAYQTDFLSVAVHEIGHVLGFGTSDAFDRWVSNTMFTGKHARAENGGNPVPLDEVEAHFKDGYEFGGSGELTFDPIINKGDRALPTRLDVAALNDIGYTVDYGKTFKNA